ncbi:type IX secretion system membrane protein PorP/SprF [Flagellimonas marinaquae]
MNRGVIVWIVCILGFGCSVWGQEKFLNSLHRYPAFMNPSFHAFQESTKIGVASEFISEGKSGDFSQHRYAFGTTFFESYNFQLAVDFYNNKLSTAGYNYSNVLATYAYKLRLDYNWTLYPAISAGYGSYRFDFNNLVFQDQLDILSGRIRPITQDPIIASDNFGFFDVGFSAMLRNDENFVAGLSVKHLNQPALKSKDSGTSVNLNMLMNLQLGYEVDLNRYGQNRLPDYSFLYLFTSISRQGKEMRNSFFQEVTLSNVFVGISEHINMLEGANFTDFGLHAGMYINGIEFGVNYRVPFGATAQFYVPNSLELNLAFDLMAPRRRRSNFSRFY